MTGVPDPYEKPFAYARAQPAIDRAWTLASQWVTTFLKQHPTASADEIVANANVLNFHRREGKPVQISALQLSSGSSAAYIVAINLEVAGTLFAVVRKPDGQFRSVWSIKDEARKHPKEALGPWASLGQSFVVNGPFTGSVHGLPASRKGAPRFYIDAKQNPLMGSLASKQISIWEWDGRKPLLRFSGEYVVTLESEGVSFEGDLLKIETKDSARMKVLDNCSACTEPAGLWTLRVTPDGIEDLGHTYVDPLYPLIDDLLDRVERGEDVSDIASPQVAADLRASFFRELRDGPDFCRGGFEVMAWEPGNEPQANVLYVIVDRLGCEAETHEGKRLLAPSGGPSQLSLTIERRNAKPYIVAGSVK